MHVHSQSNSHIANSLASGFNRRHCCILRAWQNFSTFNFAKVICSVQTTAQLAFCLHFHSARVCVFAWMCMCVYVSVHVDRCIGMGVGLLQLKYLSRCFIVQSFADSGMPSLLHLPLSTLPFSLSLSSCNLTRCSCKINR